VQTCDEDQKVALQVGNATVNEFDVVVQPQQSGKLGLGSAYVVSGIGERKYLGFIRGHLWASVGLRRSPKWQSIDMQAGEGCLAMFYQRKRVQR
jgi:hypothetical protein